MAMVNHEEGGVFSYATPSQGIQGDAYWVPKRLATYADNCGTREVSVQVESDQGPSIVSVQDEVRYLRTARAMCTNSPVGESECNRRSGNAGRRLEVKFRTPKSNLERKLGGNTGNRAAITSWMARWAGEVLTRYAGGSDAKNGMGTQARSKVRKRSRMCRGKRVVYITPGGE